MDAVKNDVKRLSKSSWPLPIRSFGCLLGHMRARESSKKKSWKLCRK